MEGNSFIVDIHIWLSWQELTQEEAEDYVDDEDMNEEADVDVGGKIQYLIDFSHHYEWSDP